MEIQYLAEFVVLAQTENYLEAADTLFMSQSTLSKHIKALERELGVPLFDRTTRRVHLNQYGEIMLEYAKQIADIQYQYTTALNNQTESIKHTIIIGSIPVMAPYHITDEIMEFKKQNKNYSVNLIEGESAQLKDLLRQNKCELAFIRDEDEEDDDEFAKIPYEDDYLVAVLPSYHILANEKEITLEQIQFEDFLFLQPGSLLYNICRQECQKAGFTPNIAYTGQRAENIIDLVEKGMGISLLMRKPIEYLATPKIRIVDITPTITTKIRIYYKKDRKLSVAAKHLINSITIHKNL